MKNCSISKVIYWKGHWLKKKGRIYLIVADLSNKCPVHKKNRLFPEKNSQVPKNTAMSHFSYKNTYCKAIFDQNEKKTYVKNIYWTVFRWSNNKEEVTTAADGWVTEPAVAENLVYVVCSLSFF